VKPGKTAKVESKGREMRQLPRATSSTQQRFEKTQGLKAGVGWQANLPKEPVAPSRGQERQNS
jgi:hypothetical protein